MSGGTWQPLVRCDRLVLSPTLDAETAAERQRAFDAGEFEMWRNDRYVVTVRRHLPHPFYEHMTHLSIRRVDRAPLRDWRHFQRIKNELCGPEWEGLELYPAESRLIDEANQFHLWVVDAALPFGMFERSVGTPEEAARVGALQRPLD